MYVCMYVYVCVCMCVYVCLCVSVYIYSMQVCMYACSYFGLAAHKILPCPPASAEHLTQES